MKLRILSFFILGCAVLDAWPAPETITLGQHTYTLLRYELTPSQVQGYGHNPHQWWGTLREIDATPPYVHNIASGPIPLRSAKAPIIEAIWWMVIFRTVD